MEALIQRAEKGERRLKDVFRLRGEHGSQAGTAGAEQAALPLHLPPALLGLGSFPWRPEEERSWTERSPLSFLLTGSRGPAPTVLSLLLPAISLGAAPWLAGKDPDPLHISLSPWDMSSPSHSAVKSQKAIVSGSYRAGVGWGQFTSTVISPFPSLSPSVRLKT